MEDLVGDLLQQGVALGIGSSWRVEREKAMRERERTAGSSDFRGSGRGWVGHVWRFDELTRSEKLRNSI